MARNFPTIHRLPRDGISQAARQLTALDPASAPLDKRSLADALDEVDFLARQFTWFDETGHAAGSWDRLLAPGSDTTPDPVGTAVPPGRVTEQMLERLAEAARDPALLTAEERTALLQPHVALLLTVLKRLGRAQGKLNGLTARHLDFLYRRVLGFGPRPHRADRVHAIVRPARTARAVRLPAGTLLDAGQDATRRPRAYATEREIIVGRTAVAELRSIHAEIHRVSSAMIRRTAQSRDAAAIKLLALALGDPAPGDPLSPAEAWGRRNRPLVRDEALFAQILPRWLGFARDDFRLDFFEPRHLVELKRARDKDQGDWAQINGVLNAIGRRRTGARFNLASRLGNRFDPRAFTLNLTEALGTEPDFSGVAEIDTIDDLFLLRDREEVREFLRTAPYDALAAPARGEALPRLADDVVAMMTRKQRIDAEWQAINAYLEAAGVRRRDGRRFCLDRRNGYSETDFDGNLSFALPALNLSALPAIGTQRAPTDVIDYMRVIGAIEAYLHTGAEQARFLLTEALPRLDGGSAAGLWARADAVLAGARVAKGIAQRTGALNEALTSADADPETRARAVLLAALDRSVDQPPALSTLIADAVQLLPDRKDGGFLESAGEAIAADRAGELDWERFVAIAERVQRARLGPGADALEQRVWRGLHAFEDATAVCAEAAEGAEEAGDRWRTFGSVPQAAPGAGLGARLAWAFVSPILAMRQGQRQIELILRFATKDLTGDQIAALEALFAPDASSPLAIRLSAAATPGWRCTFRSRWRPAIRRWQRQHRASAADIRCWLSTFGLRTATARRRIRCFRS